MSGIYLKHSTYGKYMAVKEEKNWPCGHMASKWNKFTICDADGETNQLSNLVDGQMVKIKTHYTMHSNYEWAYASDAGWIYFDLFNSNEKQVWKLHKNGDKLAFENSYWPGYYLGTSDNWLATEEGLKVWWTPEN